MTDRKLILSILCCVLGCVIAANTADVPKLTFKFTTSDLPGALQTFPEGVNNIGVSVGQYQDQNMLYHGYILRGRKVTTLDDPNGTSTQAIGINPDGAIMVVGIYVSSSGRSVGFLYQDSKYTDIPGPTGTIQCVAAGINDRGSIVGTYIDSTKLTHGFLLKGKVYKTLDVPGAAATYATGINKGGKIVLNWLDSSGMIEASLYNGKTYKTINVPGALSSFVFGISAAGDRVYQWTDSAGVDHAALFHIGKYYKFDYPKALSTYGGGINDTNLIVGGYQAVDNGPGHGFKATYK